MSDDVIKIPQQFEMASDHGYLPAHIALTKQLAELADRPDKPAEVEFTARKAEAKKDEYFDQACENVARHILMDDRTIKEIHKDLAREMVLEEYGMILKNPSRGSSSRAAAVH